MDTFKQSDKLKHVCYEIRGSALQVTKQLEEEGHKITKLNIGNPGAYGFDAPDEILQDIIYNLSTAEPYSDAQGLFSARKAVMHETQRINIKGVEINDIYLGNGVSELIMISMQALLNNKDEVLIPVPDYPLWSAAVELCGGKSVHYICDEGADWFPDIEDIKNKITDSTKALVIINPNNPTGSVYTKELLLQIIELARKNKLILFADEIYDKILYDDAKHIPLASLCEDLLVLTFNGLSKNYRLAGFRSGWLIISGNKAIAKDYIEGLRILSNMRLCSNVPGQLAIQTALGGYQSVNELILPGGRLRDQRDLAYQMLNEIPGVSCTLPRGSIYMFPKLDSNKFKIQSDEKLILDFLLQEKVLIVQGSGFNIKDQHHFRIIFLPREDILTNVLEKLSHFLSNYSQA